jgi:hypothetical protein
MKRKSKCFIITPDGWMKRVKGIIVNNTFRSKNYHFDINPDDKIIYRKKMTYFFTTGNMITTNIQTGQITKYSAYEYKKVFKSRIIDKIIDSVSGGDFPWSIVVTAIVGLLVVALGIYLFMFQKDILAQFQLIKDKLFIVG